MSPKSTPDRTPKHRSRPQADQHDVSESQSSAEQLLTSLHQTLVKLEAARDKVELTDAASIKQMAQLSVAIATVASRIHQLTKARQRVARELTAAIVLEWARYLEPGQRLHVAREIAALNEGADRSVLA